MKYLQYIILFSLFSLSFSQSYIDVVKLNNGDIIKGKIIENVINDHIRIELKGGSILTYKYEDINVIEVEEIKTRTFGVNSVYNQPFVTTKPIRDCYNDGFALGQTASTQGPMMGGFLGGFTLGLIGWGVSYAIVAGGNPQPPINEISKLEDGCTDDYKKGYKEGALKVKKSSVNIGGALGTLLAITFVLSASGY